jgi:hypothetical protein
MGFTETAAYCFHMCAPPVGDPVWRGRVSKGRTGDRHPYILEWFPFTSARLRSAWVTGERHPYILEWSPFTSAPPSSRLGVRRLSPRIAPKRLAVVRNVTLYIMASSFTLSFFS